MIDETVRKARHRLLIASAAMIGLSAAARGETPEPEPRDPTVRLLTLDPGHFHAALIQQHMYPEVSDTVHVYAPLGPDLAAHLMRISRFNQRAEDPTRWRLEVHTGPDFLERLIRERSGNVVVLSGRNQGKIDRILACVDAGFNVLVDKPWIIDAGDFPKLETALGKAEAKGLVAYDVMTERYEVTSMLQKELVADRGITGDVLRGTEQEPGVFMESVHHLMKTVAGVPNLRPVWFFDSSQQGEALADVGTHLVDLVPWMLFPEQPVDHRSDAHILSARRWPTVLTRSDFQRVTGEKEFPATVRAHVKDDRLEYFANTAVSYTLRGTHVRLSVRWDYEAPPGAGDTHVAVVRGSRARIEVRQGAEQKYRTELYVVPVGSSAKDVRAAVEKRMAALSAQFPGIAIENAGQEIHISVPDALRTSHESHFAQVTGKFLGYLKDPRSIPRWERTNMLAKYSITTAGTALSRKTAGP
jgi:predicted dehydrogenase